MIIIVSSSSSSSSVVVVVVVSVIIFMITVIIVNHILVLELLSSMGSFMSDMDGDGNITILDVIQVIQVILES